MRTVKWMSPPGTWLFTTTHAALDGAEKTLCSKAIPPRAEYDQEPEVTCKICISKVENMMECDRRTSKGDLVVPWNKKNQNLPYR